MVAAAASEVSSFSDVNRDVISSNVVRRTDNIEKSVNDQKSYRIIELKNGFKALLIAEYCEDTIDNTVLTIPPKEASQDLNKTSAVADSPIEDLQKSPDGVSYRRQYSTHIENAVSIPIENACSTCTVESEAKSAMHGSMPFSRAVPESVFNTNIESSVPRSRSLEDVRITGLVDFKSESCKPENPRTESSVNKPELLHKNTSTSKVGPPLAQSEMTAKKILAGSSVKPLKTHQEIFSKTDTLNIKGTGFKAVQESSFGSAGAHAASASGGATRPTSAPGQGRPRTGSAPSSVTAGASKLPSPPGQYRPRTGSAQSSVFNGAPKLPTAPGQVRPRSGSAQSSQSAGVSKFQSTQGSFKFKKPAFLNFRHDSSGAANPKPVTAHDSSAPKSGVNPKQSSFGSKIPGVSKIRPVKAPFSHKFGSFGPKTGIKGTIAGLSSKFGFPKPKSGIKPSGVPGKKSLAGNTTRPGEKSSSKWKYSGNYSKISGKSQTKSKIPGYGGRAENSKFGKGSLKSWIEHYNQMQISAASSDSSLYGNTVMAAANLCLSVGSFYDPEDFPGLAHFLEHMIYLGSEKFPEDSAFDKFLSENGGVSNAETDGETMSFYFSVRRLSFPAALDMFAQLFISPLLKPESIDRELEAVDNEFQDSLSDLDAQLEELMTLLVKRGHPMEKFTWGNLETLKLSPERRGMNLSVALREFSQHILQARNMTLVLQCSASLDKMEEWVVRYFSDVPNKTKLDFLTSHGKPFPPERFSKIYKVVPSLSVRQLRLIWSFPTQVPNYKSKPLIYLSWVVGHQGEGSLLAYLRKRYWATELKVCDFESDFESSHLWEAFSIDILLTKSGLSAMNEVLICVFSYLAMLKEKLPCQEIFEEMKTIFQHDFDWKDEVDPEDNVLEMGSNLLWYEEEDILTGDYLIKEYDPKTIMEYVMDLRPDNAIIVAISKSFGTNSPEWHEDRWFRFSYSVRAIDTNFMRILKEVSADPYFHLPEKNIYIATKFDIKKELSKYTNSIMVRKTDWFWYKEKKHVKSPTAYIYIHLMSPLASRSFSGSLLLDLFVLLLEYTLRAKIYDPNLANLICDFDVGKTGLVIKLSGFDEKMKIFLELILNHLMTFEVQTDELNVILEIAETHYYQQYYTVEGLTKTIKSCLLHEKGWTTMDKFGALPQVTKTTMENFIKEFRGHLTIEGLATGNLTHRDADAIGRCIWTKLKPGLLSEKYTPAIRSMQLPVGDCICQVASFCRNDSASMVANHYQIGPASIRDQSMTELLVYLLEEPCFTTLRTQEQLGYAVSCEVSSMYGILGICISVETHASKFRMEDVDRRIEHFIEQFYIDMQSWSKAEFRRKVDNFGTLQDVVYENLEDEADWEWMEILNQTYLFDRSHIIASIMQRVTRKDVMEFWHKYVLKSEHRRKLSIQVVGSSAPSGGHNLHSNRSSSSLLSGSSRLHRNRARRSADECVEGNEVPKLRFHPVPASYGKSIMNLMTFKSTLTPFPPHKILPASCAKRTASIPKLALKTSEKEKTR